MYPAPPRQKSIIEDYVLVVVVVSMLCGLWIVFNEVVMKFSNTALGYAGSTGGEIIGWIILFWSILPVGVFIGVLIWAVMRATKKEPYQEWG
jgi:hypothetical protein